MTDHTSHLRRRVIAGLLSVGAVIVFMHPRFQEILPAQLRSFATSPVLLGLLITPSVAWVAFPLYATVWAGIRTRVIVPHLLVVIALTIGYAQVIAAVVFPSYLPNNGSINNPPYLFLALAPTLMIACAYGVRELQKSLPLEGVMQAPLTIGSYTSATTLTIVTLCLSGVSYANAVYILHLSIVDALSLAMTTLTTGCVLAYYWVPVFALGKALIRARIVGITIRSGDVFERLFEISSVVFTHTGTITNGAPSIVDIRAARPAHLLGIAYSLERTVRHPIATAICERAYDKKVELLDVRQLESYPGKGVVGVVNGRRVALGNMELMKQEGVVVGVLQREKHRIEDRGQTVIVLGISERGDRSDRHPGEVLGLIVLQDTIRPESTRAVEGLSKRGLTSWLMTGDSQHTARAIARSIGIDTDAVVSDVHPSERAENIATLNTQKHVGVVGNARSSADIYSHAHVSISCLEDPLAKPPQTDIIVAPENLDRLGDASECARRTVTGIIRTNRAVTWYTVISYPFAMGVLLFTPYSVRIDPVVAISASTVVFTLALGNAWMAAKITKS
ncbi:hypothetical protein COT79_00575 [Candidatus Berkelbacteria bacterium CG10_big_fil_rev_8_21_14_0_10_43_14]|uniref:Uncharacterized protein n=1 Tax=Candidatus Berkelbacteria bacterium CG10_big_fil_rev_8_21_14_0_10_43_14 TaxID=1974515 RepID=A0A2M6RB77_9BACT|nr:MAG: hypothetical protein COT79_00575 [Candidatus Berkelbacteria bacterium CG10_big_fil_rev_8_21_14_0_10_43_14]